jgi:hypothetical protein
MSIYYAPHFLKRYIMSERLLRTQILLEPEQHRALADVAQAENRSLSDVIREMLAQQLAQRRRRTESKRQRRLDALARIRKHQQEIVTRRGGHRLELDAVALIEQVRDERDDELIGTIFKNRH